MKHSLIAVCMGFAAALLVSGCSGVKELSASIGEVAAVDEISANGLQLIKNKTTKKEVMAFIGAPGMIFKNDKNCESWVYPRIAVRQSKVNFSTQGRFDAIFPYSTGGFSDGGGVAGVKAAANVGARKSGYRSAGLLINFNKLGCVSSYEFTSASF